MFVFFRFLILMNIVPALIFLMKIATSKILLVILIFSLSSCGQSEKEIVTIHESEEILKPEIEVGLKKLNNTINSVAISKNNPKTLRFPYLSAKVLESPIPIIIKIIPPALNKPKPAETGSLPKKLIPTLDKNSKTGLMKLVNL